MYLDYLQKLVFILQYPFKFLKNINWFISIALSDKNMQKSHHDDQRFNLFTSLSGQCRFDFAIA